MGAECKHNRPPSRCHVSEFRLAPAKAVLFLDPTATNQWVTESITVSKACLMSYAKGCKDQSTPHLAAEVEAARMRLRAVFWQGAWRAIAVVGPSALKYGCITWSATKAAQVLIAWTGQSTEASVRLSVLVNLLGHHASGFLAPWLVVFAMWMLYRRERRLKEGTIARLGEMTRKYELLMDPARTSSRLPRSGNANPSDIL